MRERAFLAAVTSARTGTDSSQNHSVTINSVVLSGCVTPLQRALFFLFFFSITVRPVVCYSYRTITEIWSVSGTFQRSRSLQNTIN